MDALHVRHADLFNVYGHPATHDSFTFVPADLSIPNTPASYSDFRYFLAEYAPAVQSQTLSLAIRGRFDAAWTYARLLRVFHIPPEPPVDPNEEVSLLGQGFVVVPDGSSVAHAFRCMDFVGASYLEFSTQESDDNCASVASAFWSLLLADPDDVADFERRVIDIPILWSTDLAQVDYGCCHGHLFRTIVHDDDSDQ